MPEPKVGDALWWRGMRMEIADVDEDRGLVRYRTVHEEGHYRCTSNLADLDWREDLELWVLPGTEGQMPKVLRGKIVDPEPPKCVNCDAVTHRGAKRGTDRILCTDCRLKGVA